MTPEEPISPRRLFLLDPAWRIAQKFGSERAFCYQAAPGQDHYHRLLDGEIYVQRADEKLCLACAERRGLLNYDPKPLREPSIVIDFDAAGDHGNAGAIPLADEDDPET